MLTCVFTNMFSKFDGFGVNGQKYDVLTQADRVVKSCIGLGMIRLKLMFR